MPIEIRPLDPAEYSRLPVEVNPNISICVVAEDTETKELKGYWVAQLVVHTEPVWIAPELQGTLHGIKLYAAILAGLKQYGIDNYYAFATTPEVASYLERLGLQLQPYVTYKGIVPQIKEEECLQLSQQ